MSEHRWNRIFTPQLKVLLALAAGLLLAGCLEPLLRQNGEEFLLFYAGMDFANPTEVIFLQYFLLFSIPAMLCFTYAFYRSAVGGRLVAAARQMAERRLFLLVICGLALGVILLLRTFFLQGAMTTQDEYTYDFIADTLLEGRLINPLPAEPAFFANEFVILNDHGWFGKYPIGFPLLIAAGALVGLRSLVVPLLSVLLLVVTFALGRRVFDRRTALWGALLLALSPQFLLTGATLLSQPASALFVCLGLVLLLDLEARGGLPRALLCGVCFGFAVLIRPLPGVLFLPVVGVYLLLRLEGSWPRRLFLASAVGLPVLCFALSMLWINDLQTGNPLMTGYHVDYGLEDPLGVVTRSQRLPVIVSAVASAVMRLNVWQTGFPLVLLFALAFRRQARSWLLVAMIAAAFAYRFVSPKAGVMCTGPVYVYETLPWFSLLIVDGLRQLATRLDTLRYAGTSRSLVSDPRGLLASVMGAGFLVALLTFWPVNLRSLAAGASEHLSSYRFEEAGQIDQAVVFYEQRLRGTWARYLRNPQPDLSDPVLYLRRQDFRYGELQDFVRRRLPERSAWVLLYQGGTNPQIFPLAALVEREAAVAAGASVGAPPGDDGS